jgi:AraC family transcriptional activator of pyochelin receptor
VSTISSSDYETFWEEPGHSSHPFEPFEPFETTEVCIQEFGMGHRRWIELRDTLLLIQDYQFHQDWLVQHESSENGLEFGFQILGGSYAHRCAGQSFIKDGSSERTTMQEFAQERVLQVDIHLETADFLSSFVSNYAGQIPPAIHQLVERSPLHPYQQVSKTTTAMQLALRQILDCPYQGVTRQIYLQSKCWELIALKLEQLSEDNKLSQHKNELKRDDIDRIYAAKDILIRNWQQPPALLELAHQVGLNDYKLKYGFRQVFGTTAFGYLWNYRMDQARQLLVEGRLNVKEVATLVGYSKQSNFAAAFRKKFGSTPKAYLAALSNPSQSSD